MVFAKLNSSNFSGSSAEIYHPAVNGPFMNYPAWYQKDFRYKTSITDMSLNFGFNLSRFYAWRPKLSVVLSAGIGLMSANSSAQYIDSREQSNIKETYSGKSVILPIGLDVHYRITKRLKLGVAANYNYSRNDNLDLINPQFTPFTTSWDRFGTIGLVLKYKVL